MSRTRRLLASRSGSVAVTTALAAGTLFAVAALTIDGSRLYLLRRKQQAMADLAAVAAAANLSDAQAAAAASLAANGLPASQLAAVELGTYTASAAVPAAQRFTVGAAGANAARVTLRTPISFAFGAFAGTAGATVAARAIAVNANTAAFALGSTTTDLDGGLADSILGKLTGSTLGLTTADYAALSRAGVDLFGVANALAARVGATGTYAALAARTVRVADVLSAAADAGAAAGMAPAAVAALRSIAAAIGPSGPSLTFGNLVGFAAYGSLPVGSTPPVPAPLPLLALVSAAARLGAGTTEISTGLGPNLPAGITAASVKVALAAPGAGSSFAAVGPVGTTLHTAQTRVLLTLKLPVTGGLTALNLPVYVETGPATASISAIGCTAGAPVDPAVTLSVTPGVVDGWIGDATDAMLTDLATPLSPAPVTLTNLGVVAISGRAHAAIANTGPTSVPFTRADIAAGTMKSTSTADVTSSLLSKLFSDLKLSASTLGFTAPMPSGAAETIGALLAADLAPIDRELTAALATLGITVGDADTWVRGVRCGQGALVN